MANPQNQLNHVDAKCIYQNLNHLMTQPGRTCPFGQPACNAWHNVHLDDQDPSSLKQWIEKFLTHDQRTLLQKYCTSAPGKNGKLLDSLETNQNNGMQT
jgi:hypothetical protein